MDEANIKRQPLCVVIPALNEQLMIGRCIESLLNCDLPPPDIYVIDDGSIDNTALVADSFGVNVIRNSSKQGKAASLKRIIAHFNLAERYEYVALLDADTYVGKDYVRSVTKAFAKNSKAVIVSGQPKSVPCNWLTAYRAFSYFVAQFVYKPGQAIMKAVLVAPGCASAYKSSILDKLEWNSETLVEDMDVTIQVYRKHLGEVAYEKGMVTYTQDPRSLLSYIGQMNRWYSGTWQIARKYHMPWGMQMIDFEFALLLGEGLLVSSAFVLLLPVLFYINFKLGMLIVFWEFLVIIFLASFASGEEKR